MPAMTLRDRIGVDLARCGEVTRADSHGRYEEHLRPGEGTIDFRRMFARLEGPATAATTRWHSAPWR